MKLTVQDVSNFQILDKLQLIAGKGGLKKAVTHCGILDYEYDKDVSSKYYDYNYQMDGFLTLTSFLYAKNDPNLIFDAVKNALVNLPTTLKNIGSNGISGLANAITGLKSTAVNAAKGIFTAVKDKFLGLPSALKDIGKNLVTGLWNGITNKTNWLASKITSFASGVIKSAKEALGVHSPSTEFAYIGDMCIAGFEEPMEKFNPYQTLQNSMEANMGTLKATFAKTSIQSGSSFAFDYGQFGQEVKSSMQGVAIYMDGEKVGQLVTQTVNNELPTYSGRRI